MATIEIFKRRVFGVLRAYPVNAEAKTLMQLIDPSGVRTTIHDHEVELAKQLGLEFVQVDDPRKDATNEPEPAAG